MGGTLKENGRSGYGEVRIDTLFVGLLIRWFRVRVPGGPPTENPCVAADPTGEQLLANAVDSSRPGRAPRGLVRHTGTGHERGIASRP